MNSFFTSFFSRKDKSNDKPVFTLSKSLNLDNLVKGAQIEEKTIHNYSEYNTVIESLISSYKSASSELDYRYKQKFGEDNSNINQLEKMIKIGKLGLKPTSFLKNSMYNFGTIGNNNCRIESDSSFVSIRTNNCLISGKWFYEAELLSNGLQQIGFCQANTSFTNVLGVGDDIKSYSFDGYRMVTFNEKQSRYGDIWDTGDIVGCLIDLDNNKIEYYLNGVSLGVAFTNIYKGPNIAYFPGISLSSNEKCTFNFGNSNFEYKDCYPKEYEPIDIPISIINNSWSITQKILNLFKSFILPKILNEDKTLLYSKILLTYKLYYFLSEVSFKDEYIIRTIIIPFLSDLLSNNKKEYFQTFFKWLIKLAHNNIKSIISLFFDILSNSIERYSLRGKKGIDKWTKLIKIFKTCLNTDDIVEYWIEDNFLTHLKSIFNSNTFSLAEFYKYLDNKYNIKTCKKSVNVIIDELVNHFYDSTSERYNTEKSLNDKYTAELSDIIYIFLTKTKKYKNGKTLKDYFNEHIKKYQFNNLNEILMELGINEKNNKTEQIFYANIYHNLINIFTSKYLNKDFESFSTELFINRVNENDIYFGELCLGGTLANCNENFGEKINKKLLVKNDEFFTDFFHKIIRLTNEIFVAHLVKKFFSIKHKFKIMTLSSLVINERNGGTTNFEKIIKKYFYLFTINSQILYYKFGFFLIKFLNYIKETNPYLLYYVPVRLIELPFIYFKLLLEIKSKILHDPILRNNINKESKYFEKDDFMNNIIQFYLFLFADPNITHPETREKLLIKVNVLAKTDALYENINLIFDNLIKGLLIDMQTDSLSYLSSKLLCKLIKPICFGSKENNENKSISISSLKHYFLNNIDIMNEFLKHYSKLTNAIMTDFSINLSKMVDRLNSSIRSFANEDKVYYYENLSSVFNIMCNLIRINEFLIFAIPDLFLNPSSLNHFNFVNTVKNLSLRILAPAYFKNMQLVLENLPSGNYKPLNLYNLCCSVIGLFLKIENNKNNCYYLQFMKEIANSTEIKFDSFFICSEYILKDDSNLALKKDIDNFNNFIKNMPSFKDNSDLTQEQIESLEKEGKICILCYERKADTMFIPCGHNGCKQCIKQYRADKSICFICHANIDDVKLIDDK